MKAGNLNNLVLFQTWREGYDAAGQPAGSWHDYMSMRGNVVYLRGEERWAAAQVQAEGTITLEFRYNRALFRRLRKGLDRIRAMIGDRVCDISDYRDPDGRRKRLHLEVKERL